ncbi:SPRY domain-containing protein 3 [Irineochytrium annulatum]|nr:SPRY domain-containing protein 3 [Irineochytrium annulatum]
MDRVRPLPTAESRMLSLSVLPLELVQEVASFLDASAIINLARTSTRLRHAALSARSSFSLKPIKVDPLGKAILAAVGKARQMRKRYSLRIPASQHSSGLSTPDSSGDDVAAAEVPLGPPPVPPPFLPVHLPDASLWMAPHDTVERVRLLTARQRRSFALDGILVDDRSGRVEFDLGTLADVHGVEMDAILFDSMQQVSGPVEADDGVPSEAGDGEHDSDVEADGAEGKVEEVGLTESGVRGLGLRTDSGVLVELVDDDDDARTWVLEDAPGGVGAALSGNPPVTLSLSTSLTNSNSLNLSPGVVPALDATARTHYVGRRQYFSRSVHSRLPLHIRRLSRSGSQPTSPTKLSSYFYFEVKAEQPPEHFTGVRAELHARVGIVPPGYSHHHLPGSLPDSIGYQAEDGYIGLGHREGETYQFASPWSYGDTVGCGFFPQPESRRSRRPRTRGKLMSSAALAVEESSTRGVLFFTLNGHWVGDAPHRIDRTIKDYHGQLHACVGSSVPAAFTFNLGEDTAIKPFLYSPANDIPRNLPPPHLRARTRTKVPEAAFAAREMTPVPNVLPAPTETLLPPVHVTTTIPTNLSLAPHMLRFLFPNNNVTATPRCLQSPHPLSVPRSGGGNGCSYYEVTLESGGAAGTFIAVGLAPFPYGTSHHVGWDFGSVGYHSDDAKIFDGSNQGGRPWGDVFGEGDVVGCGLTPEGDSFFTLNGKVMGHTAIGGSGARGRRAARRVGLEGGCVVRTGGRGWRMHPTVTASGAWTVTFNFGDEPFRFDVPW